MQLAGRFGKSSYANAKPRSCDRARTSTRLGDIRPLRLALATSTSESGMKNRQTIACARCRNIGTPRQLNELVRFDRNEPALAEIRGCKHLGNGFANIATD